MPTTVLKMKNMKHRLLLLSFIFSIAVCSAQTDLKSVVDFKPSEVNQPGKEFPKVNSEGRVRVQIEAPEANKVQLDIGGVKYDLRK